MANMLEGGRTPLLPAEQLQDMGFKIVAYPLSLLGAYVQSMQRTLQLLHKGGPETFPPSTLPSFESLQAAVGFPEYLAGAEKYATLERGLSTAFSSSPESHGPSATPAAPSAASQAVGPDSGQRAAAAESPSGPSEGPFSAEHAGVNQRDVVEADAILPGPQPFPKQDSAGRRSSSGSRPPVQPDSTSWQDPAFRRYVPTASKRQTLFFPIAECYRCWRMFAAGHLVMKLSAPPLEEIASATPTVPCLHQNSMLLGL